jgi:phenylpropionate dioxygenase-like ring-hydroxylating dioxygenase large terminal subunit
MPDHASDTCPKPQKSKLRAEWRAGAFGMPVVRYVDKEFAALEAEKLWPHVWQVACRLEEIPNPGSYAVYQIIDQSIVVVRQPDGSVKAFNNVCPHRATALAMGFGRFQLEQIVCPFHGWKWNLQGENIHVLDPGDFMGGCLDPASLHLKECRVASYLNCVWINLDPAGESFDEFIGPMRAALDPLLLDQMYFHWHKSIVLEANWKVAQEAFFEGYHVPQTHPQLVRRQPKAKTGTADAPQEYGRFNSQITAHPQGHGYQGSTDGGPRGLARFPKSMVGHLPPDEQVEMHIRFHEQFFVELNSMILEEDVQIARTMRRHEIPEGSDMDSEFQRVLREHYARQGRAIAPPEALSRVGLCHLFPNYTLLPLYGNVLIYRSRPTRDNDPDRCIFEVWSCRTYPEGQEPPQPVVDHVTDPMDPAQMVMFLRQDFANIPRQQIGMHSKAINSTLLNGVQEEIIANMHRALDRVLER